MIIRWQSDGTGCSSDPKEAATCEFVAPCERYTSRINVALSLGEQFRQGVRLLRLTCRAADGPAPPSLTQSRLLPLRFLGRPGGRRLIAKDLCWRRTGGRPRRRLSCRGGADRCRGSFLAGH